MLIVSKKINEKLKNKHQVTLNEVYECIANIQGELFEDTAEEHKTIPPSFWFVSQTNSGRWLKIVIVPKGDDFYLKTAFEAKLKHIKLYETLNKIK